MTKAAQDFLRSFRALPSADQHDVLVNLLRLPLEVEYLVPSEDELTQTADHVFAALDEAENQH